MINLFQRKKTSYIFNLIALSILVGAIGVNILFVTTSNTIQKINMTSNLEYIDNITSNISKMIVDETSKNIYHSLKLDKSLRDTLEKNLQLLITKKYRYIYIVDKKTQNRKSFRFLLDGAKTLKDKSEFEEEYTPLNFNKWNSVYRTKKALYYEHKDIKDLWLTYLKPIIIDDNVKAIIVIDFSLDDHKNIVTSLDKLDNVFDIVILFSVFIFITIILFAFIDGKRIKELKDKTQQIKKFNETLELRIDEEVKKNREKDKQILQQSRLAQMGEMISMIAHQWRQPLSAIGSTSVALNFKAQLHKLDDAQTIELTNNISDYVSHLSTTIDDFRDFFKSNKIKNDTTYNEILSGVLGIIDASIKNRNITIVKELQSELIFHTYINELKQVVLNLLKNAEDILLEKNIENPKILIKTYDNVLEISDNAGGVPSEILDKVFDPYFSTKKEKNGTGLGLYMSKTIIEEHCDGTLSVHNNDEGAVFTIKMQTPSQEKL